MLWHRLLLPLFIAPALLQAENWPQWRGPRMDGTSLDQGFPSKWEKDTITWRVELPGSGHASPIVWNDRLFLVATDADTSERTLLSVDRSNGKVLWQTAVLKSPLEGKHRLNSHASSTPATDGERVFTTFLDGTEVVVSAHDFSGKQVWQVRPGVFASKHGFCSSPILFDDKVIVNCDHDGPGYIVALSRTDGRQLWRIERPNQTRSYCVPIIREMDGRVQMVLSGSKCVTSYDPRTGSLLWMMDGPTEQFVASLVHDAKSNHLMLTGGFPEHHILAIKPDGVGNVTDTHIVWRTNKGVSYVPSPICENGWFLIVSDSGIAHCFDAKTGDIAWEERMKEHHASLVSAEGKVWFINDFGTLRLVKPGKSYKTVVEAELEEKVFASPALSEGQVFIRGEKTLMCLGKRTVKTAAR
ncbi:PQQ-like beta-propeller repeat protein [Brevifollis gellanilyticus]|uniref:Serine/threonine protein kinase n=1 Tax=Brevifollis gellanilyticus TaxID=748831 RepID=A0A512MCF8_9BACT|nr:PQQ-like beta-propeller repeat protein [Brevifollis gellanilyticus]GEP44415.1 serine/threonine protein kinase [Brevifollis gellanilyticus]